MILLIPDQNLLDMSLNEITTFAAQRVSVYLIENLKLVEARSKESQGESMGSIDARQRTQAPVQHQEHASSPHALTSAAAAAVVEERCSHCFAWHRLDDAPRCL